MADAIVYIILEEAESSIFGTAGGATGTKDLSALLSNGKSATCEVTIKTNTGLSALVVASSDTFVQPSIYNSVNYNYHSQSR